MPTRTPHPIHRHVGDPLTYARALARRKGWLRGARPDEVDDRVQIAALGLLDAARVRDAGPLSGGRFATLAIKCVVRRLSAEWHYRRAECRDPRRAVPLDRYHARTRAAAGEAADADRRIDAADAAARLAVLTPRRRRIVRGWMDGQTIREVAAAAGWSEEGTRRAFHDALRQLRETYAADRPGPVTVDLR